MTIFKTCTRCGAAKPAEDFVKDNRCKDGRGGYCKACDCRHSAAWHAANPDYRRALHLKKSYGISISEYDAMLRAQGGVCAICEKSCGHYDCLSVDHHHGTGEIRGLLCNMCNRALGMFRDSSKKLSRAQSYLAGKLHVYTHKENKGSKT